MIFSVINSADQAIGTIEVEEDVYNDDDALVSVLTEAGYLDSGEVHDVIEPDNGNIDIYEYESGTHRVSLVLVH